jgi:hypothetical protein
MPRKYSAYGNTNIFSRGGDTPSIHDHANLLIPRNKAPDNHQSGQRTTVTQVYTSNLVSSVTPGAPISIQANFSLCIRCGSLPFYRVEMNRAISSGSIEFATIFSSALIEFHNCSPLDRLRTPVIEVHHRTPNTSRPCRVPRSIKRESDCVLKEQEQRPPLPIG